MEILTLSSNILLQYTTYLAPLSTFQYGTSAVYMHLSQMGNFHQSRLDSGLGCET